MTPRPLRSGHGPLLLAAALAATAATRGAGPEVEGPMDRDPKLPERDVETVFPERLGDLWLAALERPEANLQRLAARAVAEAHGRGMTGLEEAVPRLRELLRAEQTHRLARLAAVRALGALDVREAAAAMLAQNRKRGGLLALRADDALARWGHEPARELWRDRATDRRAPRDLRVSAIEALAAAGAAEAGEALGALARSEAEGPAVRLAAAEAAGELVDDGLTAPARELAGKGRIDGIVAARMLAGHRSAGAKRVLVSLARSDAPAVALAAGRAMHRAFPDAAPPLAARYAEADEPGLRRLAARIRLTAATPGAVAGLAKQLADRHPDVRAAARDALVELGGRAALAERVRKRVARALDGDDARALAQAAHVLGKLDHEPAWRRLRALLAHERTAVGIAAARALRRLAAGESLAPLLETARGIADGIAGPGASAGEGGGDKTPRYGGRRLIELFQLFGLKRHEPAAGLLRRFIPKDSGFPVDARAAAIWALGRIRAGASPADLAGELVRRVTDGGPKDAEARRVREMAAVALGRMKARSVQGTLRELANGEMATGPVAIACRWALAEMAGEQMAPLEPRRRRSRGWFLEPIRGAGS